MLINWLQRFLKVYCCKGDGRSLVVSARGSVDFDYIRKENYTLLQWGKNPIKFICVHRRTSRPPPFIYSINWETKLVFKRLRAGYTFKPIDTSKFWRTQCENKNSGRSHLGNTTKAPAGMLDA